MADAVGGAGASRAVGSVVLQVGGLELLARYSMNSARATSMLSSLHEFRTQEAEIAGNKDWNWRYLRDQFDQKSLETLYIKYDDKLREGFLGIFLILHTIFTICHMCVLVIATLPELHSWHPTYTALICYTIRLLVPNILYSQCIYDPAKKKYFWIPVLVSSIVIIVLVITDLCVAVNTSEEALRPAYATLTLLSCYVLLPLRNNIVALVLGLTATLSYLVITALFSYATYTTSYYVLSCDFLYFIGVNALGMYFRLMNEVVTRRSFLDRRACVESTLRLNHEKDQEERLMLSILPEHIASRVRRDIRTTFLGLQSDSNVPAKKNLSQMYIEEHKNVTILYADVVNYTKISTTLPAVRMVELLNELFGRFDEASEEHEVLRIKFLGDCYYCVSGVPEPNPQHAKSCVDLGLDMIAIIKDVREKRSLNIDMRIGIHTGKILSGLIGIRKWQYDIWSKDATIANRMESTGKPGKVHVTKQTLESLRESAREYVIEPHFEAQNDPLLRNNKIETYLLSRSTWGTYDVGEYRSYRRISVGLNKKVKRVSKRSDSRSSLGARRRSTAFMDNNLLAYQQMLRAADSQMQSEIESMPSGKISEYFYTDKYVNLWTLMFRKTSWEKPFVVLPDPLFKYYVVACAGALILIFAINGLSTSQPFDFSLYTWLVFSVLLFGLTLLQPLTWFQFLWTKHRGVEEPRNAILRGIYDVSSHIVRSARARTLMYLFISTMLAAMAVLNVYGCSIDDETTCVSPWHVTETWILALLLCFLFSRVFFLFKWLMGFLMAGFYMWLVWESRRDMFVHGSSWNVGLDPGIAHSLLVIYITLTLYWVDRRTEYRNRLDHVWQLQLTEEEEEASTMLKVNNMLLQNILPVHVVEIYLDVERAPDELYYEKYENVAVMFASLTDYKLGGDEDLDMGERTVLAIMDQIISDFDRLLLSSSPSAYRVEKIKMAGWTYMAACGLDCGRRDSRQSRRDSGLSNSSLDSARAADSSRDRGVVITMVQFAAAMMLQLRNFNKGSFQSFEGLNLKVGVSNGEVAAGVVGSLKPLYDIWGHAVNMASRMDSTGEAEKIHVTENTAIVLDNCGILTEFRGRTFVKGAGYIRTYFVPLDHDYNLMSKERHMAKFVTDPDEAYLHYRPSDSDTETRNSQSTTRERDSDSQMNEEDEDVIETRC